MRRFISITTNARETKLNGVAAAMSSGGSLTRPAQLVENLDSGASISMDGSTVTMINGYSIADAAGIYAAANVSATDYIFVGGTLYALAADCAAEHLST